MSPRLLDLFCGAGGASMGYHRAGFEVVGVDIEPQPHYPFEFHQADAIKVLIEGCIGPYVFEDFAAIGASPVCHDWSALSSISGKDGSAQLLHQTLFELRYRWFDKPWIVENVSGAPLATQDTLDGHFGTELCGTMFRLQVLRHRRFESNVPISAPPHGSHEGTFYSIAGHGDPNWRHRDKHPEFRGIGYADRCRAAMGIDWMPRDVLAQAIPPAYTEHLGGQLLKHLSVPA